MKGHEILPKKGRLLENLLFDLLIDRVRVHPLSCTFIPEAFLWVADKCRDNVMRNRRSNFTHVSDLYCRLYCKTWWLPPRLLQF